MKICIDAGHGGKDSGAVHNGVIEKDHNLRAALKLKGQLMKLKHKVIMTREDDSTLMLGERVAKSYQCDLFISLHCNASPSPTPFGVQVYVYSEKTQKLVGDAVQSAMEKIYNTKSKWNHVVSDPGLYVLKRTKCPAILLEMGFLTNKEDSKKIQDGDYIPALMTAVAEAVDSQKKEFAEHGATSETSSDA